MSTGIDRLRARLSMNNENYNPYDDTSSMGLARMKARLEAQGGSNQLDRLRQNKLKSLEKALLYSYQSAVVQKYEPGLREDVQPYKFRCLMNHDKLKVAYQDKIISIPFSAIPIGYSEQVDTDFKSGTVFKWVHGNKQEWTPDTYWIVYLQYSQETAYFRAQIRKADSQIQVVVVTPQGEETLSYRGWMTGPEERAISWNLKRGVIWNEQNYHKLLYITKDSQTKAFFQRFDRVVIDGKPWQVQAYNDDFGSKSGDGSGIIRVALKQTYTSAETLVERQVKQAQNAATQPKEPTPPAPAIFGRTQVYPYEQLTYTIEGTPPAASWSISNPALAKIVKVSQDGLTITVDIVTGRSNKQGFDIRYGDLSTHIKILSY